MVPSDKNADRSRTTYLRPALLALTVLIACALYVLASIRTVGHVGFPLDDSWIHQTYARNLVEYGEWSFVPGVPSTGATSIVWPILLAPAHLLAIDPVIWSFILGGVCLFLMAWLSTRFYPNISPGQGLILGLSVALEWHLVWAAVSGMETILFSGVVLAFWVWYLRHHPSVSGYRWQDGLLLGLWGSGLMLVRPEGIVAPAIGGLLIVLIPGDWRKRIVWAGAAAVGLVLILIPFLAFNQAVSGDFFPNTFYAKQTEYQILWSVPYIRRFFDQALISLVGPQIVLLPGIIYLLVKGVGKDNEADPAVNQDGPPDTSALRYTQIAYALPLVWVVVHWAIFAGRLPQTYQHGRYAMPTVAILVIYGVYGALQLAQPRDRRMLIRVPSLAWLATAGLLFPGMLVVLGAPAYAADVAFIDGEMVAAAEWLSENTEPTDVIAAHDIGALGYFSPRPLVDLAGLVSPEVIPFMTDADQLYNFIQDEGASYLVIFPRWSPSYERLSGFDGLCMVWTAAEEPSYVQRSPSGPMTVYTLSSEGLCDT